MDQTFNGESDSLLFWLDFLFTTVAFLVSFLARDIFLQTSQALDFYSHLFILALLLVLISTLLSYFGGYENPVKRNLSGYAGAMRLSREMQSRACARSCSVHLDHHPSVVVERPARILVPHLQDHVYFLAPGGPRNGQRSLNALPIGDRDISAPAEQ